MTTAQPAATDTCELLIPDDHPAYLGHFPGFPILPGAVLLDEALHSIMRQRGLDPTRWRLASAKLLAAVRPGDTLTVEHSAPNAGTVRFIVRSVELAVASGMLAADAAVDGRGRA